MDNINTEFPTRKTQYIKPSDFQDNETVLTFQGWKKKGNVDDEAGKKKNPKTWKEKLKYQLRYTYPEWAIDSETGEKMLDRDGNPFKNSNYDPNFPHGYTILYIFDEGELDSGSLPLFNAFCRLKPRPGDSLKIKRTGQDRETKWSVKKQSMSVDIESGELAPDEDLPF